MSPQRLSVNEIIRRIRARIVTRRVLQGIAITFAVAAVTLIGASILANKFNHKQALLIVLRIVPLILTIERRRSSKDISLWWAWGIWGCLALMLPASLASPDPEFRIFGIINIVLFTAVAIQVLRYR